MEKTAFCRARAGEGEMGGAGKLLPSKTWRGENSRNRPTDGLRKDYEKRERSSSQDAGGGEWEGGRSQQKKRCAEETGDQGERSEEESGTPLRSREITASHRGTLEGGGKVNMTGRAIDRNRTCFSKEKDKERSARGGKFGPREEKRVRGYRTPRKIRHPCKLHSG